MPWAWRYMAPSIVPLMRCSCPVPLAEKHPQSIMFPPPCLMVGMVFLGSQAAFLLLQTLRQSHLTTTLSHSSPLNLWHTPDRPVHGLSWAGGPCRALQDFSPSQHSVLPIVFLVTMVPPALRSMTRSSRVVLGWYLTVLMIIETPRGEILHGAPARGRLTVILFLPFANNRTNCCHLLTKLLGDGFVAHSSLVQVYNLVPGVLGQLFGLGHGGEFGIWLIDCFCGHVSFIQVTNWDSL